MSDIEPSIREAVQPVLRPGEQVGYIGLLSRVVPMAARVVPIIKVVYTGQLLAVLTSERLILFPASFGLVGGPQPPKHPPSAIELVDVARVEAFNPVIILHKAVRITLRQGLTYEFMFPGKVTNLDAHVAFAENLVASTAQRVQQGAFAERTAAERNLPMTETAPPVGTWLLMLAGAFVTLASLAMAVMVLTSGLFEAVCALIPVLAIGVGMFVGGLHLRRKRMGQLGIPLKPLAQVYQENRKRILIGGVAVGLPLTLCCLGVGGLMTVDAYRRAEMEARYEAEDNERLAQDTARAAELARFPARGSDAPEVAAGLGYDLPGDLPALATVQSRLEAAGFHVAGATTPQGWSLVATGQAEQTITMEAVVGTSDAEVTRRMFEGSGGSDTLIGVRGPQPAMRQRYLDNVTNRVGGCHISAGVPICAGALGGRVVSPLGQSPVVFEAAGGRYEVTFTPRPRGSSMAGPSGFLGATTTVPASVESNHRAGEWSRWALVEATRP